MSVFWDVVLCSLIDIDRRFGDAYCLHHQGDHREVWISSVMLSRVPSIGDGMQSMHNIRDREDSEEAGNPPCLKFWRGNTGMRYRRGLCWNLKHGSRSSFLFRETGMSHRVTQRRIHGLAWKIYHLSDRIFMLKFHISEWDARNSQALVDFTNNLGSYIILVTIWRCYKVKK
jgi:hypothetical protein